MAQRGRGFRGPSCVGAAPCRQTGRDPRQAARDPRSGAEPSHPRSILPAQSRTEDVLAQSCPPVLLSGAGFPGKCSRGQLQAPSAPKHRTERGRSRDSGHTVLRPGSDGERGSHPHPCPTTLSSAALTTSRHPAPPSTPAGGAGDPGTPQTRAGPWNSPKTTAVGPGPAAPRGDPANTCRQSGCCFSKGPAPLSQRLHYLKRNPEMCSS